MAQECFVYIGTYTRRTRREGIYIYRQDLATGQLNPAGVAQVPDSPAFVVLHPTGRYLYAVSEVSSFGGEPAGGVKAFSVDAQSGALTLLNQQSSGGPGPCHVSVDKTGRYLLVANYSGGSVAMLPINEDGSLEPASDFHQHQGSGSDPRRQEGPHAHSIWPDPDNRYALVPDLGMDKVMVYKLDLDHGKLVPNDVPWATLHPGAGPRHLAFHPNGKWVYVINELDSTMTVFSYDAPRGVLTEVEHLSTLPAWWKGQSWCADVHVHPSGKFVYGSNRGYDSIVVFAIDEATGKLTTVDYAYTVGEYPRNFGLDPSGSYLVAANQNTDNVLVYKIDQATGKLTPTGQILHVAMPVCVKWWPISS
jgi:6-phosphogluconolactonase